MLPATFDNNTDWEEKRVTFVESGGMKRTVVCLEHEIQLWNESMCSEKMKILTTQYDMNAFQSIGDVRAVIAVTNLMLDGELGQKMHKYSDWMNFMQMAQRCANKRLQELLDRT